MDSFLPTEVLEVILGFVDSDTLRTARLVSRTFRTAASAHICSLMLTSTSEAVNADRFPRLASVTYRHGWDETLVELDPGTLDLVAESRTSGPLDFIPDTVLELVLLAGLQKLDLDFHVKTVAPLLRDLTSLEVIRVGDCHLPVATTLMTMTPVTELRIGAVFTPWNWGRICKVSWLERATTLSNLRALYIRSPKEAVPLIGSLTSLTGLSWLYHDPRDHFPCWRDPYSIAPFTHLSRLRSLRLGYDTSEENLSIACSLGAGSLVDLHLCVGGQADTACGRYLTCQTALTRLGRTGSCCGTRGTSERCALSCSNL
jgi:hypothetical protein